MDKLLSACVHYTVNWFCTFSNPTSLPLFLACVCVSEICVMKSLVRVYLHACVCECVKFYLRYLLPPHFVFYAKFLLACSTCLLCTTLFLLLVFTIILRSIICSYETKLNFSSLFFFHQVRRLLLLSCFPFLSAACHVHFWRHATLSGWESMSVYWWARVPTLMRGGGACVCGWSCLNSCFFLFCFASGKRD